MFRESTLSTFPFPRHFARLSSALSPVYCLLNLCGTAAAMSTVIKVENLSKRYRLGVVNSFRRSLYWS